MSSLKVLLTEIRASVDSERYNGNLSYEKMIVNTILSVYNDGLVYGTTVENLPMDGLRLNAYATVAALHPKALTTVTDLLIYNGFRVLENFAAGEYLVIVGR